MRLLDKRRDRWQHRWTDEQRAGNWGGSAWRTSWKGRGDWGRGRILRDAMLRCLDCLKLGHFSVARSERARNDHIKISCYAMHSSVGLRMVQALFRAMYRSLAFDPYPNPRRWVLWLTPLHRRRSWDAEKWSSWDKGTQWAHVGAGSQPKHMQGLHSWWSDPLYCVSTR